jgi:hypothetical protein
MVAYIKSDLEFILQQIKIAEAHAVYVANPMDPNAAPLYGTGLAGQQGSVPSYNLSFGLRTVDGSYNNLLPGQEKWGASDRPFPELLDPVYRPADGTMFDPDGPGPAPAMPTAANYNPSNNPNSLVFDASLRTISNLIVDQTLANPAAIIKGLQAGGVVEASLANVALVQEIYAAFKPALDAEYQARVAMQTAKAAANALDDGDPGTPPSQAEQAAMDVLATATATHALTLADLNAARVVRDAALVPFGLAMDGDNVQIVNVSPDVGLSAPFNSWFTLFGQFFDHGLDLVNKGGSGTVFVPLQPDDPLYVPGSHTNFMVLTRATVSAGPDNVMGTADDVRPVNTTTPFVDQNQTYSSHPSHQVFLRHRQADRGPRRQPGRHRRRRRRHGHLGRTQGAGQDARHPAHRPGRRRGAAAAHRPLRQLHPQRPGLRPGHHRRRRRRHPEHRRRRRHLGHLDQSGERRHRDPHRRGVPGRHRPRRGPERSCRRRHRNRACEPWQRAGGLRQRTAGRTLHRRRRPRQ